MRKIKLAWLQRTISSRVSGVTLGRSLRFACEFMNLDFVHLIILKINYFWFSSFPAPIFFLHQFKSTYLTSQKIRHSLHLFSAIFLDRCNTITFRYRIGKLAMNRQTHTHTDTPPPQFLLLLCLYQSLFYIIVINYTTTTKHY